MVINEQKEKKIRLILKIIFSPLIGIFESIYIFVSIFWAKKIDYFTPDSLKKNRPRVVIF